MNESYFTGPGISKQWIRRSDSRGFFQIPYAPTNFLILNLFEPGSQQGIRLRMHPGSSKGIHKILVPARFRAILKGPVGKRPKPKPQLIHALLLLQLPPGQKLPHSASTRLVLEMLGGGGREETWIHLLTNAPTRIPVRVKGLGPFRLLLFLESGQRFEGKFTLNQRKVNPLEGVPVSLEVAK